MRNTAFLLLGLALVMLQSNLFRVIGGLRALAASGEGIVASIAGMFAPAGVTPSLLLPLVIFMGVHEYMMWRGALLAFALGYMLDVFAGAPLGLYTFTSVTVFVVSRVAGVRLAAQTLLTKIALAFAFALLEGTIVIVLTAIFGGDAARPRALASLVLPYAVSTAIFAPLVFRAAERLHQATLQAVQPEVPEP
jgi:rod shape-determining protein MreD